MSFGQGLSGLNAASQNLDSIGNNIANSGTVGYKASTVQFADVYANSRIGLGVQVSRVSQRFSVGNVSNSGNQFDMAIDGANGLFRLEQSNGAVLFSRNGQFYPDKAGYLVNAQGHYLTGYGPGGSQLERLQVPSANVPPKATTALDFKPNLPVVPKRFQKRMLVAIPLMSLTPQTTVLTAKRSATRCMTPWVTATRSPNTSSSAPPMRPVRVCGTCITWKAARPCRLPARP